MLVLAPRLIDEVRMNPPCEPRQVAERRFVDGLGEDVRNVMIRGDLPRTDVEVLQHRVAPSHS